MLDAFLAAGGNLLDTADTYSDGVSEQTLAPWLARHRDEVVVATKVRFAVSDPGGEGLEPRARPRACDASLRRLGTDAIDLYQVHAPDPDVPLGDTLEALDGLVREGKVRALGASNFPAWLLAWAVATAGSRGLVAVRLAAAAVLARRALDRDEILPFCRAAGLGVLPWGPLGAGFLAGRYRRGERPPEARMGDADETSRRPTSGARSSATSAPSTRRRRSSRSAARRSPRSRWPGSSAQPGSPRRSSARARSSSSRACFLPTAWSSTPTSWSGWGRHTRPPDLSAAHARRAGRHRRRAPAAGALTARQALAAVQICKRRISLLASTASGRGPPPYRPARGGRWSPRCCATALADPPVLERGDRGRQCAASQRAPVRPTASLARDTVRAVRRLQRRDGLKPDERRPATWRELGGGRGPWPSRSKRAAGGPADPQRRIGVAVGRVFGPNAQRRRAQLPAQPRPGPRTASSGRRPGRRWASAAAARSSSAPRRARRKRPARSGTPQRARTGSPTAYRYGGGARVLQRQRLRLLGVGVLRPERRGPSLAAAELERPHALGAPGPRALNHGMRIRGHAFVVIRGRALRHDRPLADDRAGSRTCG